MADETLRIVKQGVTAWNEWRRMVAVFGETDLRGADLRGADLSRADFSGASLSGTDLSGADLSRADFSGASLSGADLSGANLRGADLSGADFSGASLREATLSDTNLSDCQFDNALFWGTVLSNVDLSRCKGLELIRHDGPSLIDIRTLQCSDPLPLVFLRGVGLPDNMIDYLPSLLNQAIQRYSCFISYSTKDQLFADRLHADLQNQGVRCWFAPHDLPIGAKTWDAIDEAIRLRDKLLLILSEASIASDWVEDEVSKAYAEERDRKTTMLFPIRIDDVVMATVEPWARKLRDQRNIGDFRHWKDHDAYQKGFDRLLRDLRIK